MAQFPPHASYRASGLPWLKTVPSHWQETRLKHQAKIQTGITLGKVYDTDLETRPYLRVANVQSGFLNLKHVKTIEVPRSEAVRCELRLNDVVLTEGGDIDKLGRGAIWTGEIEGCIHQNHIFAVRPNLSTLTPKFLTYVLESPHGRAYFQLTAKQTTNLAATNRSTLGRFPLFLPPRPEQDQIVAYLRAQDAHIARYIKTKRELIALLTEQKLRIIDQAVTRGLDASVKLKPSGIEWLGEVPEHWEILPLRRILRVKSGDMIHATEETKDGYLIYGGNGPRGFTKKANCIGPMLLIGRVGAKCGCVHHVEGKFWASEHALRVIPLREIDIGYFEHLLRWIDFNRFAIRTAQPLINSTIVRSQLCAVPPLDEQQAICHWIAGECQPLNEAIQNAKDEITLIREYRDRLIADVVTGQIDVRGWQPGPDDAVNDEDLAALGDDEECEESAEEDGDGAD